MEHKAQTEKVETELRNRATELVIEQDRQYVEQEKQRQHQRAKLLAKVTEKNKEVRAENLPSISIKTISFILLVNATKMGLRSMESYASMACRTRHVSRYSCQLEQNHDLRKRSFPLSYVIYNQTQFFLSFFSFPFF